MTEVAKEIRIFYSWQSDLDEGIYKLSIRRSIRKAIINLENKYAGKNLSIHLDEATSRQSGSSYIPKSIIDNIEECDIFIADVSIINSDYNGRQTCNPNVLYELGYATAVLGEPRIIMVFNEESGKPENLPFDIRQRKLDKYRLQNINNSKAVEGSLGKSIESSIDLVINQNPNRTLRKIKNVQANRDVALIDRLLKRSNAKMISELEDYLPYHTPTINSWLFDEFQAEFKSPTVIFSDKNLSSLFSSLHESWGKNTNHSNDYHPMDGSAHTLTLLGLGQREVDQNLIREVEEEVIELNKSIRDLLEYVADKYSDIDLSIYEKLWKDRIREIYSIIDRP